MRKQLNPFEVVMVVALVALAVAALVHEGPLGLAKLLLGGGGPR